MWEEVSGRRHFVSVSFCPGLCSSRPSAKSCSALQELRKDEKEKKGKEKEKEGIEYNGNKHQPVYQVRPLARSVRGLNKRPFLLVVIIAGGLKAGVIFTRVRSALIAVLLSPRKRESCRGKKLSFFSFFFSPAITIFPAIGILWDFFL